MGKQEPQTTQDAYSARSLWIPTAIAGVVIVALVFCGVISQNAEVAHTTRLVRGIIDTSRLDDLGRGEAWTGLLQACVSLGRAGTGEDIANLVAFLCSDQGAWITGQHIRIDGGHNFTPRRLR